VIVFALVFGAFALLASTCLLATGITAVGSSLAVTHGAAVLVGIAGCLLSAASLLVLLLRRRPAVKGPQTLRLLARFALLFCAVVVAHLTLLHLPYYWDEGGYYIPAALDFYHRFTLVPEFTNAHPPLPNVVLGLLWHIAGYSVLATRLCVCAFAAAGLLAVYTLVKSLATATTALAATLLVAVYPIWYAQSTLAHADIFAAAFALWAITHYLCAETQPSPHSHRKPLVVATLLSLAVLSKETAIITPATLFLVEAVRLLRDRAHTERHLRWLAAFAFPVLPLVAWYAYHHHVTGFTFGNPEYLRYNATANLTRAHVLLSLKYRAMHLLWQRNLWVPITLALATLLLPRRSVLRSAPVRPTPPLVYWTIGTLAATNWIFFSVLGGALLTRYLLPVYALLLAACVLIWRERFAGWLLLVAVSAAALGSAIWINGPHAFAPEDNITYRDMIVVHQRAIDYLAANDPDAHVLTAWPVAADLVRPDLGYTTHIFHTTSIDNFTRSEVAKAAQRPASFDTVLAFTTKYEPPAVLAELAHSTDTTRLAAYEAQRDMTPEEIAQALHGTVVWQTHIGGEWSAILRIPRNTT
jgi:hypothetical protein